MTNKEIISINLQDLMDKNQKSRKEVCAVLGLNYATFSDWLQGRAYPRPDKIEALASYFGVSRSALVDPPQAKSPARGQGDITVHGNGNIINGDNNGIIHAGSDEKHGEICDMYQALPEDARKRVDRMIKGEYEDALQGKE